MFPLSIHEIFKMFSVVSVIDYTFMTVLGRCRFSHHFEGAADHLVSESLYLRHPDNNGVEIYRGKNRSEWKRIGEFQVEMSTERLDLDPLFQEADNFGPWRMPENTVIGHVHLHVSYL